MTARGVGPHPLGDVVEAAVAAGADWVQVRDRALEGAALLAHAADLAARARRGAARRGGAVHVLVNRRLDVAAALGAEGAHLGFDAVGVPDARSVLGAQATIGVSVHLPDDLAATAGADYAFLAPVFAPRSKAATRPPLGPEALARACSAARLPVLAQGGIDAARVAAILRAGAAGVALTGEVLLADDPGAACARIRRALDGPH